MVQYLLLLTNFPPLAATSEPTTCTSMWSFLGAFKAISRCIPRCSSLLSPLEDCIKGLKGGDHIKWNSTLSQAFTDAKSVLSDPKSLVLPYPSDKLTLNSGCIPLE